MPQSQSHTHITHHCHPLAITVTHHTSLSHLWHFPKKKIIYHLVRIFQGFQNMLVPWFILLSSLRKMQNTRKNAALFKTFSPKVQFFLSCLMQDCLAIHDMLVPWCIIPSLLGKNVQKTSLTHILLKKERNRCNVTSVFLMPRQICIRWGMITWVAA